MFKKKKKKKWLWIVLGIVTLVLGIVIFKSVPRGGSENKNKREEKFLEEKIIQPSKKHSATVIFLHGLGDNSENWIENFQSVSKKFPHIKFVFPQAPRIPVSMNWGFPMPAWYNIKGNPRDILSLREDKQGLMKSVGKIKQIIQREVKNGIPTERIMVIGFSQGASVALTVGLVSDCRLVGIIGLSSFLPCRNEIFNLAKEENKKIPFFLYHNRYDNVIPALVGEQSYQLLKGNGYKVDFAGNYSGDHFFQIEEFQEIITKNLSRFLS
jgi:predicted esterase